MTSESINTKTKLSSRAWLIVLLLFVVAALNYLDRTMITTMRGSIIESIPMTESRFGLLTAVFLWVYGLLSPFAGFLADRFKRSHIIIISLFVWSLVTWLTSHATTYNQLLTTRALMGISEACYIPAALALIMDYHRDATRSLATGIHMGGIMVGQSLGFVGSWIAERQGWHLSFGIIGGIGMMYSVLLVFMLKDVPKNKAVIFSKDSENKIVFFKGVRDLLKRRSFILLLFYWSLLGVGTWTIAGWLPTYYKEHFHLSQSVAGLYATAYLYPASFMGLILGGLWADRWNKTNRRARMLVPIIGLCISAPFIFTAMLVNVLPVVIAFFMVYVITRSFCDANMMPILCIVADPRYRATGYGVLNMFSCIIGGVGLYAGGYLRDSKIDIGILYKVGAVIMVICAGILFRVNPKTIDNKY
jgi:predicted MFS family arabinose efflux permease